MMESSARPPYVSPEGSTNSSKSPALLLKRKSQLTLGESKSDGRSQTTRTTGLSLSSLSVLKGTITKFRKKRAGQTPSVSSQNVAVENNYRTPPPNGPDGFCEHSLREVTNASLNFFLAAQKVYDPSKFATLSRIMADDIKQKVKSLGYTRYKYIVEVTMGEDNGQAVQVASRCVWDTANDRSVCVVRKDNNYFVVVNVFATYFE